tara:strand:+ start:1086 stop:1280 length:195 start_codon:yes stop_codon:yes gene_type:complete
MSRIEEQVIEQIRKRAKVGESKYGATLERKDLNLLKWLQHLQEELMDAACYVEKLKEEYAEISS